jgi:hypothetical protein
VTGVTSHRTVIFIVKIMRISNLRWSNVQRICEIFYYFFIILSWVRLSPLPNAAPHDRWWGLWSNWWNEDWQGKPKYSEKTCPSATLSTTNPAWPDPDSNPGRRGGKPATNPLSYGTARFVR